MIVCPNCNHQNPDGAVQCEACYTPLPATGACPLCGASVQADASFCGQCGFNLQAAAANVSPVIPPSVAAVEASLAIPVALEVPASEVPLGSVASTAASEPSPPIAAPPKPPSVPLVPVLEEPVTNPELLVVQPASQDGAIAEIPPVGDGRTELQHQTAALFHVQTETKIELPQNLTVIHLGKPNDRIPPDIDVSGFPNSEIVSRIHADIRIEGNAYYVEDVGSSNGTYINNLPLQMGNRHRLRAGDRLSLGKGDKVTFLFQLS